MAKMLSNWTSAFEQSSFRNRMLLTLISLALTLFFLPYFFAYVEGRTGYQIHDWVLEVLPPTDLTWFIFIGLYSCVLFTFVRLLPQPGPFLFAVNCYLVSLWFRLLTLALVALEPPIGLIELKDPFVALFGVGEVLHRDLFFSGHTATMVLVIILNGQPRWPWIACTIAVAGGLLAQHVHYTADVVVAPVFALISVLLVRLTWPKDLRYLHQQVFAGFRPDFPKHSAKPAAKTPAPQ